MPKLAILVTIRVTPARKRQLRPLLCIRPNLLHVGVMIGPIVLKLDGRARIAVRRLHKSASIRAQPDIDAQKSRQDRDSRRNAEARPSPFTWGFLELLTSLKRLFRHTGYRTRFSYS
jgi:hypothetical protein